MKVGIVSDGQYGERAFEEIRRRFSTIWIPLPFPSSPVVDEMDLSIPQCDLYVSYLRHPDVAMQLVRTGVPVLLGVNLGPGFIAQAKEFNQAVIGPETMCSVIPDTGFWQIDEYARAFGRPVFHVVMDEDRIRWCHPIRGSPCGSTKAAARELDGQELTHEAMNRFALSICHHCRAPRFGKTCDKEKAGIIHLEALVEAIKPGNPGLWKKGCQFIESIVCSAPSCQSEQIASE